MSREAASSVETRTQSDIDKHLERLSDAVITLTDHIYRMEKRVAKLEDDKS